MVNQPKYRSYAASTLFADGRAMRPAPDYVIAREAVVDDGRLTAGFDGSGYVTEFPIRLTKATLERGRDRYDIYCAACHGITGDSDTPVAVKMQLRRPPSLHEERLRALGPGQLYHVVNDGYGLMPGYSEALVLRDRWAVVAYVKALQLSRGVPMVALPAALQAEARRELQ
jgi:mono/diheme cytochrome c family protein